MTTATMRSLHRPRKNLVRCQICAVAVVLMTTATAQIWQRTRFFLGLCKLRIVALIVFTALVGMALATPGMIPLNALVWGTLGIGMASASAAAINHLLDERADRIMAHPQPAPANPSGQPPRSACICLGAGDCFHAGARAAGQCADRRAHPGRADWLRHCLHSLAQARHSAKHRHWRGRRRRAAHSGLDRRYR